MNVILNGKTEKFAKGVTVKECINAFSPLNPHVIVEINREIISKRDWDQRVICDEDVIELIGFVGGG